MHLRAVGDGLFGLGLLRAGVAFGVDDGVFHTSRLEGLLEETAVVGFPARR